MNGGYTKILLAILTVVVSMATVSAATIKVNAPSQVVVNTTFDITVEVSDVNNLTAVSFEVVWSPLLVNVSTNTTSPANCSLVELVNVTPAISGWNGFEKLMNNGVQYVIYGDAVNATASTSVAVLTFKALNEGNVTFAFDVANTTYNTLTAPNLAFDTLTPATVKIVSEPIMKYMNPETHKIDINGLMTAIFDWQHGGITTTDLMNVIWYWQTGTPVE